MNWKKTLKSKTKIKKLKNKLIASEGKNKENQVESKPSFPKKRTHTPLYLTLMCPKFTLIISNSPVILPKTKRKQKQDDEAEAKND